MLDVCSFVSTRFSHCRWENNDIEWNVFSLGARHRHKLCACEPGSLCLNQGIASDLRQKSNVDKRTKRLHIENCGIKLPLTVCPLWLRISCRSGFRSPHAHDVPFVCVCVCKWKHRPIAMNIGHETAKQNRFLPRGKNVFTSRRRCNQIKFSYFDWSDANRISKRIGRIMAIIFDFDSDSFCVNTLRDCDDVRDWLAGERTQHTHPYLWIDSTDRFERNISTELP